MILQHSLPVVKIRSSFVGRNNKFLTGVLISNELKCGAHADVSDPQHAAVSQTLELK